MIYDIIFHPLADTDLIDTFNWHQEKQDGLGKLFYDAITKKVIDIAAHPERYPLVFKNFR